MPLENKVAIVTGAAGGIGEAYARGIAAQGAAVVVADIEEDAGRKVAAEIAAAGGEAIFAPVDIGSNESTEALAAAAIRKYGGIDFLVNNAAIFGGMKMAPLIQVDWDYYTHFMDVNLNGALRCVRACYRSMRERGGGSIVNQSSTAAWMGIGFYGVAKLALNGLTQSLARELGPMKIRVNAIAPGPTDTAAARGVVPDAALKQILAQMPLARQGRPEDLVGMLLFLLSDASSWVTGQILNVDGGQIMRP